MPESELSSSVLVMSVRSVDVTAPSRRSHVIKKVIAASVATGGLLLASAGVSVADADAHGAAVGSPGVLSGNQVQAPVDIPVNVCGNTVDVVGALNPAFGNDCVNKSKPPVHHHKVKEHKPKERQQTPPSPAAAPKPVHHPQSAPVVKPALAKTGGEGTALAIAASAGLLAGGVLLYRRGRDAAARG